MIHQKAIILTIALLVSTTFRANAQTYNWAITHTETSFVDDTDTVKSSHRVITRMNMSIEPESQHRLRVTINSLDIKVPDTPSGTLHYNSTEPDSDDPETAPNRLAQIFKPLAGLTFTLTYDPDEQIITASEELTDLSNLGILGQSISPPYLTIPFAPFMMAANLGDDQADQVGDSLPRFKLIPNSGGFNTNPMDLDYKFEQAKPIVSASLNLEAEDTALLQGLSMDATISVSAQSDASMNSRTQQVMAHTYTMTQSQRSTEQSTRKYHTEFTTAATITSVAHDSLRPTESTETD